jgi:hypothetical protein
MGRIWCSTTMLAALAATAGVAGCGGGAGSATDTSVSAGAASASPAVTGSAGAAQTASGSPVPAAGKVEVRLGKASYRIGEVVTATVANGSDKPIYTEDFKTVCSIVMLQRSESGAWKEIQGCALGRPTVTVMIEPGAGETITIDPNSFHLRDGGNRLGFGSGTYRVKFGYRLDRGGFGQEPLVVYSPTFEVH